MEAQLGRGFVVPRRAQLDYDDDDDDNDSVVVERGASARRGPVKGFATENVSRRVVLLFLRTMRMRADTQREGDKLS